MPYQDQEKAGDDFLGILWSWVYSMYKNIGYIKVNVDLNKMVKGVLA